MLTHPIITIFKYPNMEEDRNRGIIRFKKKGGAMAERKGVYVCYTVLL